MKDDVLTEVLVLGLEVLINHISLNGKYKMGYYVGSFDGMTYGKKNGGFVSKIILKKRMYA